MFSWKRVRSWLGGADPTDSSPGDPPERGTPSPSGGSMPSNPTITEQLEMLSELGVSLREPLTVKSVEHAVARELTESEIRSTGGAMPIPPYHRAAFWWLFYETIGNQLPLTGRHRIHPPDPDPYYTRKPSAENLQQTAEKLAQKLCADTGAPLPTFEASGFESGQNPLQHRAHILISGQPHVWTLGTRNELVGVIARACETADTAVLIYDDIEGLGTRLGGVMDLMAVPRAHAEALVALMQHYLAPIYQVADHWSLRQRTKRPYEDIVPAELWTAGLPAAEDVPLWSPEDPPSKLDEMMAHQDRLRTDWLTATGAAERPAPMDLDRRIEALRGMGIPLNPAADLEELREHEDELTESWEDMLGESDSEFEPLFRYVFAVPDSPLDSFEDDWPPVIEELAAALERDDVTDISAHREEDGDGHLEFTLAGTPHRISCEFLGKHIDREALEAAAELMAPADRQLVRRTDLLVWPLRSAVDEFEELTAGG